MRALRFVHTRRSDLDLVSVSHLEMFLPDDVDSVSLKEARAIVGELPVFWEAPPERAEQTIALIAGHNSDERHGNIRLQIANRRSDG